MRNEARQSPVIRTPDYRLRVFVSSTLTELAEERAAVREAILRLRLAPVLFELGARPHPADRLYRAYLQQSHIFIGMYWQSYGWIAPEKQISGLEDEYNLSSGLPRLLYIKKPAPAREAPLDGLLARIRDENAGCYKSFSSPEELGELVQTDLALLLSERFEASRRQEPRGEDSSQNALTNVPFPRNSLIGRENELKTALELLTREDVNLVTLTGPGGCGKSRLGIQIALEMRNRFPDGVYLVMLEVTGDPKMVVPIVARTLGVEEPVGGQSLIGALKHFLGQRQILLLLDNFEQVLPAAPQIAELLESCPGLKALVTSRAPLRLRGEHELPVPALALPPMTAAPPLRPISQYSAVELFIRRAQAVHSEFKVTNENAPAVAAICHRLDGLPLAIELAAARAKLLSPQMLLERLSQSLDILRGGTRDLPERQKTLHSTIDWSYRLLDETGTRLLRRLSVFVGGWSFEAADEISNSEGEEPIVVLDALEQLVDLNLIRSPVAAGGELRFQMLETIREFSLQRLFESDEANRVQERHARFFLALVERSEVEMQAAGQIRWSHILQNESANIRAALAWSRDHDANLGLRLCAAIWRYWETHNLIGEARQWLEILLARSRQVTAVRGRALIDAAACAVYTGDYASAHAHAEEALGVFRQLNDKQGVARALNEMGLIASYEGDFGVAKSFLEQSLAIKRELGSQWEIANAINNLGLVADYQGDYESAYALIQECLAIYQAEDDKSGVAMAYGNLGHVALHLGRLKEAWERQVDSIQLFHEVGDWDGLAECFERLAMVSNSSSDYISAAQWFGVASVLRKQAGTQPALADKMEYEREWNTSKMQLGQESFEAAWMAGREIPLEEAISLADAGKGAARRG